MRKLLIIALLSVVALPLAADFQAALASYNAGRYREAISAFQKILDENPAHLPSYGYQSAAYLALEQYEPIVRRYPAAIREGRIDLNSREHAASAFEVLKSIGIAALYLEQNHRAIVSLRIANKMKSDDARVAHALGLAYLRTGKVWQAELFFKTAVHLEEDNQYYMNSLGVSLLRQEKNQEALEMFEKAALKDWNYTVAWNNLWQARASLGMAVRQGWKSYTYFVNISDAEREKWAAQERQLAAERQAEQQRRDQLASSQRRDRELAAQRERDAARQRQLEEERRQQEAARLKEQQRRDQEAAEKKRLEEQQKTTDTTTNAKPDTTPVPDSTPKPPAENTEKPPAENTEKPPAENTDSGSSSNANGDNADS
jgi:tetratricopeptide (TPR) repeat protein